MAGTPVCTPRVFALRIMHMAHDSRHSASNFSPTLNTDFHLTHSVSNQASKGWNSLPEHVVTAPSLD